MDINMRMIQQSIYQYLSSITKLLILSNHALIPLVHKIYVWLKIADYISEDEVKKIYNLLNFISKLP